MAAQRDELIARGVSVRQGYTQVLSGLDLTLQAGAEPMGLVGESATGKTTLARTLVGQIKPDQGTVTLNGRKISSSSPRDKKFRDVTVRFISQNGMFSAKDSVLTGEKLLKSAFTKARRAGRESGLDAQTMFDLVGLAAHDAARAVNYISGGQRQRLALAIALATRPKILILDEPVTALDEPSRRTVMRDVVDWCAQEGTGILLISHDLPLLEQVTTTTHVLAEGRIVESGPLRDLMTSPQHQVTRGLAEAIPQAYLTAGAMRA